MIFLLRSDLLIVLAFIIVLRLLIPFELPFTVTIPFTVIMNPLHTLLNAKIIKDFTVLMFVEMVWLIGCIIQTSKFIFQFKKISKVFTILEITSEKKTISDYTNINRQLNYPVWVDQSIPFPMILGLKRIILLPQLALEKSDLELIILHELEHLKHHDNVIKLFLNLLLIIYWWFPPVYWLCNRIQLVLEMRVDKCVTKEFSEQNILNYADTLVNVQKKISKTKCINPNTLGVSSTFYINDGSYTLYYRVMYLLNKTYKKSTNIFLVVIIFLIPLLSNSIVLEPFYEAPLEENDYFLPSELNNDYIIQHSDGTYTLHSGGDTFKLKEIDPIFKDVPIIKE